MLAMHTQCLAQDPSAPTRRRTGAATTTDAVEYEHPKYPFLQLQVEAPERAHHKETKHNDNATEKHESVSIRQRGALVCKLPATPWIVSVEVCSQVIDGVATHPAPIFSATRTRHVVATADLVGKDTTSRAGLGFCADRKSVMLVLVHLLPVSLTRLTSMCIGMVEAELRSTLMAFHLQYDATLFVSFGLAEGVAAGALP